MGQPNKSLNTQPKHPSNDYLIFKNFMAQQINGKSKGLFEKFEARHDHKLVQQYCDSLRDDCIGYALIAMAVINSMRHPLFPCNPSKAGIFITNTIQNKH